MPNVLSTGSHEIVRADSVSMIVAGCVMGTPSQPAQQIALVLGNAISG
jgi:hypothetical protein